MTAGTPPSHPTGTGTGTGSHSGSPHQSPREAARRRPSNFILAQQVPPIPLGVGSGKLLEL